MKEEANKLAGKTSLNNTYPDSSEVPPVMTSEVKRTLKKKQKKNNNNKAPGIDNLTSDVMIPGGEESTKVLDTGKVTQLNLPRQESAEEITTIFN